MNYRNAAIVLGAGASKGARLRGGKTPPLDADFLLAAANYFRSKRGRGKHREGVRAWRSFKSHLRGAGLDFSEVKSWRLEQLSTFLEARASLKGLQLGRGRPRDFTEALEALKVLICYVLRAEGGTRTCELHKALFDLVQPSSVLSFNYDLIADQSMLELGLLDWRGKEYRGGAHAAVPTSRGTAYKLITTGKSDGTVPLLKLHGSLNWEKQRRGDGFRLSGCRLPQQTSPLFDYVRVPSSPYIIPPVAAKVDIRQPQLRERWRAAVRYLHSAPAWIIWGYSFPGTDTISQVLFKTALSRNRKPKPVLVINPDSTVAPRVVEICRKVSVRHYSSVERFLFDRDVLELPEADAQSV